MKICVYAICKNEMEWIDRWLDNMSGADYIVVLDTGSTDGSYEKLQQDSRVTRVEQKVITPWRFDVARNESMKLIPPDTDICVCTDFDEIFEEGWSEVLRANWLPTDTQCHYTYAWSHNSLGEPQDVFMYDKIHSKDYHWVFPVHEVLVPNEGVEVNFLEAGEYIYLHHLMDTKKQRSYYFDLLKLTVQENPEECHCRMMLAREYVLKKDYENALVQYRTALKYKDIDRPDRASVKLECYLRIGDCCWLMGDIQSCYHYYFEAIKLDNTYREPYLCLAEICLNQKNYVLAEAFLTACKQYTVQHFSWVERSSSWLGMWDHLMALTQYGLKNYIKCYDYVCNALEHDPENVELLKMSNNILKMGVIKNVTPFPNIKSKIN